MNRLEKIWKMQSQFQRDLESHLASSGFASFNWNRHSLDDKQAKFKDQVLHSIDELLEALRETNYRVHRKPAGDIEINRDKLKKELIDTQLFLLNCFLLWNVSHKEWEMLMIKIIKNNRTRFLNGKK